MSKFKELRQQFKKRLSEPGIIIAPGVHEMVSLRLANTFNFDALYMTGYGTVASSLGLPDAGLATYSQMLERVQLMADMSNKPLIADGDTGYGGLLNIRHTIRGYEHAGAAAIQLEDQEFPKKCGHTPSRRVIDAKDMVRKIQVAKDSRTDDNFLIIARTDARTSLGIDEALRRGDQYAKAGADILFIESPESIEEMRMIGSRFDIPVLANMVDRGKTPVLSKLELQNLGYQIAIFPVTALLASVAAMSTVYSQLSNTGSSTDIQDILYDFTALSKLMGFEDIWNFEKKYVEIE
jgi:2-methylisocitrate lyase-like PEP mutase family enzyme